MYTLHDEDLIVKVNPTDEDGVDIMFAATNQNGCDAINTAMDITGATDVESYVDHLITSTADEVNEKYQSVGGGEGATEVDIEKIRVFAHKAIVSRVNETLNKITKQ